MQTARPALTRTVSSVMSSRCGAAGREGGLGAPPCMSCAQARRDAVRGDAVSPDGVAGRAPGGQTAGGGEGSERSPHLESLQVSLGPGRER